MSGMIYERGSVVSFTPCTGWVAVRQQLVGLTYVEKERCPVVGWVVGVFDRQQWVVKTGLYAVIVHKGKLRLVKDEDKWVLKRETED